MTDYYRLNLITKALALADAGTPIFCEQFAPKLLRELRELNLDITAVPAVAAGEQPPIWERMREAAETMEEARKYLGHGYSPEYRFDIETLRSHADRFEFEALIKEPLTELIQDSTSRLTRDSAEFIANRVIDEYDVTPKAKK